MRLANYGMIGLNGSVSRPEPSADFADYQTSLANYRTIMNLRSRKSNPVEDPEERLKRLAQSVRQTIDKDAVPEQ